MARPNWEYIRVDVLLPSSRKLDGLSPAAKWTLVEMWCHCGQHLTDGFVRDAIWRKTGSAAARRQLVDNHLAEQVDGGWQMHDYLGHQRSRAEVLDLKAKRAAAGRKGGNAKASATANATEAADPVDNSGSSQDRVRISSNTNQNGVLSTGGKSGVPNGTSPGHPPDAPKQVLQQTASKTVAEAEAEADKAMAGVISRPNGSRPPPSKIERLIITEILDTTGRAIDQDWAAKIQRHILDGRTPADPAAYIRTVIRNDPNPRNRFLPVY